MKTEFEIIWISQRAERLRGARRGAGFRSAKSAAAVLKVSYPTYAGHENGSRGIKDTELVEYSKAFNVSLSWLAFGTSKLERRFILHLISLFEHSSEMLENKLNDVAFGLIEVSPPFPIPDGLSAVRFPDSRFIPHYFPGELLLVSVVASPVNCLAKRSLFLIEKSTETAQGRLAIPGTILREGENVGTFDIQEASGRVHINVKVIWSAEVIGVVRESMDALSEAVV